MITKPALIVMAAGMGSRYGGMKQIDPVGPNNEIIIDYSVYDALKAGFGKIVFVIKEENKEIFREKVGKKTEKLVDTEYVFQRLDDVPAGFLVPSERIKPWGTAHAVMSCRNAINTPFAVINADDFYGYESFKVLHNYLENTIDRNGIYQYCMVGFILENTLTENGHVSRGVCSVDSNGNLVEIHERIRIEKFGRITKYTEDGQNWAVIPEGSMVSMNMWGFTPSIFKELENHFSLFYEKNKENLLKAEYFLPEVVGQLLAEKKAKVRVLASKERWYGVTYQEDKPMVRQAVMDMIRQGVYPEKL